MKHSTLPTATLAIIGVNYQEFKPGTYKGVTVSVKGKSNKVFNTGNFTNDYKVALDYADRVATKTMKSSKIDHFLADNNLT